MNPFIVGVFFFGVRTIVWWIDLENEGWYDFLLIFESKILTDLKDEPQEPHEHPVDNDNVASILGTFYDNMDKTPGKRLSR